MRSAVEGRWGWCWGDEVGSGRVWRSGGVGDEGRLRTSVVVANWLEYIQRSRTRMLLLSTAKAFQAIFCIVSGETKSAEYYKRTSCQAQTWYSVRF
jgi:hypothetical protein